MIHGIVLLCFELLICMCRGLVFTADKASPDSEEAWGRGDLRMLQLVPMGVLYFVVGMKCISFEWVCLEQHQQQKNFVTLTYHSYPRRHCALFCAPGTMPCHLFLLLFCGGQVCRLLSCVDHDSWQ